MIRTFLGSSLVVAALAVPALAQQAQQQVTSVAGQWRVQFVTPAQGEVAVTMTINQSGTRLTGHVIDEYGESPLEGRVVDDQVTVVWSVPEDGKILEITMKGKLESPTLITGTAKLGDVGEGPLSARRTGDAGDY